MVQSLKPKVLILTAWYPNKVYPLMGNFVKQHAKLISSLFETTVIFVYPIRDKNLKTFSINEFFTGQLREIIVYYPQKKIGWLNKIYQSYAFFKAVQKAWKRYNTIPDVCHVNILNRYGIVAWIIQIFYRVPFVITEHSSVFLKESNNKKHWIKHQVGKFLSGKASGFSVVSKHLLDQVQTLGYKNSNFVITPNIIRNEFFVKNKMASSNEIKTIIHVTNYTEKAKNSKGLIKALALLKKNRGDFRCLFLGMNEGGDWGYELLAEQLGVTDQYLNFRGLVNSSDLSDLLSQSAFLVSFSNYETFGITIFEALATGTPVIATKIPAFEAHIDNEKGILVEPGNIEELAQAMNTMLNQYQKYNPELLRNYVYNLFSDKPVIESFVKLYPFTKFS